MHQLDKLSCTEVSLASSQALSPKFSNYSYAQQSLRFSYFYYNCQPILIYRLMGFSVLFPYHHSIFKSTTYVGCRLELGYFWWMSVSWVVNYIMRYLRTMNNAGIFSVERCRSESKSRLKYSSWNAHQTHTLLIWKVPMLSLREHGTLWGSDTD